VDADTQAMGGLVLDFMTWAKLKFALGVSGAVALAGGAFTIALANKAMKTKTVHTAKRKLM
jgi:hypothetical protein